MTHSFPTRRSSDLPEDFARSHPGGTLGRRLLTHVRDVMRQGAALPTVPEDSPLFPALEEMSAKGMGMTIVLDAAGKPTGIFRSEEQTSELQSLMRISYAVLCLKKETTREMPVDRH